MRSCEVREAGGDADVPDDVGFDSRDGSVVTPLTLSQVISST